jgi:hypothetical protein
MVKYETRYLYIHYLQQNWRTAMKERRTTAFRLCLLLIAAGMFCFCTILLINSLVVTGVSDRVIRPESAQKLEDVDCILVLGCYVHDLRLQCLEFFGKFYEDGGKPFRPLAINTKYVDIQ